MGAMNDRFSLKAGLLVRYNSDPALGADNTDTITSFNLVYNFSEEVAKALLPNQAVTSVREHASVSKSHRSRLSLAPRLL